MMDSCKNLIKEEFNKKIKGGMVSADILKQRDAFKKYALSTIKTNLSRLKKAKFLNIGFRTRGGQWIGSNLDGSLKYKKGKCYYLKKN